MKELKDTVDMMLSDDYKERFKAEFHQLQTRTIRLEEMFDKWDACGDDEVEQALGFTPKTPYLVLRAQLRAMQAYLDILGERAHIEGVEL